MKIKIYEYNKCSTCRKALKFLDDKGVAYQTMPIVESPPTLPELVNMLSYLRRRGGALKDMFNASGVQYRELKVADQLRSGMTEDQALDLLSKNGKLIKRPFLLTPRNGTVGFKPETWLEIVSE